MKNTWTIKELNETDNLQFAICILNERKNKLTNPNSPLSNKIREAVAELEETRYDRQTGMY